MQHWKFDRKVRNLLAAVGSDDEDEDFGALFSQLARCYFYTLHFTRKSWHGILLTLLSLQGKAGKVFFLVLWTYKPFTTYSMRDQSSNLQGEDRKAYAEKVTVSYLNVSSSYCTPPGRLSFLQGHRRRQRWWGGPRLAKQWFWRKKTITVIKSPCFETLLRNMFARC